MNLYIDPALFFLPMVLWAGFIGVIIAAILVLDRDWQLVPSFVIRRFVWAGLIIGVVSVKLSAVDLFLECDWATLTSNYGEAVAWVMWIMSGC